MDMVQYRAIKELHHDQDVGEYISWGIKGYRSSDKIPETSSIYIRDVFLDENEAMNFAHLCTSMKLSLIHLKDVVNDYLER